LPCSPAATALGEAGVEFETTAEAEGSPVAVGDAVAPASLELDEQPPHGQHDDDPSATLDGLMAHLVSAGACGPHRPIMTCLGSSLGGVSIVPLCERGTLCRSADR